MTKQACQDGIREAFKDLLSDAEIETAFEKAQKASARIRAQGKVDDFANKVVEEIAREAELTKVAAALQRRHAALNAIVRDRLDTHVDTLISQGLSPKKAVLSFMEGSTRAVELGRVSVYAQRQAFETKYMGGMMAELDKAVPHAKRLLDDKAFSNDVVRELAEIKIDGDGGVTGNKDAQKVAEIFAKHAEVSRKDLNKLGASIGKLDGWGGPHRHDNLKISKVSEKKWIDDIIPKLDRERSFPGADDVELRRILTEVYREIVTGQSDKLTPAKTGKTVGPANIAKSLSKSRVMHFRDADAWIEYNDLYGDGTIMSGMISHQQRAAAHAAQMAALGPNPQVMLEAKLAALRDDISKQNIPGGDKARLSDELRLDGTSVGNALLEMQGMTMSPVKFRSAQIAQGIRNYTNMTSLGGATLTAVPTDTLTAALASMFRGGGFVRGFTRTMNELTSQMNKAERREIAFLLGEGFDGIVSGISSSHYVHDGIPGGLAKSTDRFFKFTGLTGWTDNLRAAASRVASSEMAMRSNTSFDKLPVPYKSLLQRHGIDANKWEAMRTANSKAVNGIAYATPDQMRNVDDALLEPLIKDKLADIEMTVKDPVRRAKARERLLSEARDDLELSTARLFADEVSFAVVETDAASRRISLQGSRPGTATGEAIRFIMQFKGFPIAFTQRVLGRAVHALKGPDKLAAYAHLGSVIAGLTAAGYASLAMKDLVKGNWPPRELNGATIIASLGQGGALGLYGDFLFGQVDRFGNAPLETAAGPVIGRGAEILDLMMKARDGDVRSAQALNQVIRLTPFNNLWYAKPVVDALVLNSAREWASPGYRRRQEKRLRDDFGQQKIF